MTWSTVISLSMIGQRGSPAGLLPCLSGLVVASVQLLIAKLLMVSLMPMLVIGLPWTRQSPLQNNRSTIGHSVGVQCGQAFSGVLCSVQLPHLQPHANAGGRPPCRGCSRPSRRVHVALGRSNHDQDGRDPKCWHCLGFFVYSVATDFSNSANGALYSAQVRALLS